MAEYGKGPEIFIVPSTVITDGEANGGFKSTDNDGQFYLSQELVNQFSAATPDNKQAALLLVVMTIFHECVHLGINKHAPGKNSENGNWRKSGYIYYFKNAFIGFNKDADVDSLKKDPKYRNPNATTEDGHALEDTIWFFILSKRGADGINDAKKNIKENPKPSVTPQA